MRRALLLPIPLALVLAWWCVPAPTAPLPSVPPPVQVAPARAGARAFAPPSSPVESPPSPEEPAPAEPSALSRRAEAIRDACGLPLATTCSGESCVVYASTPPMDGLYGWLQLGWSSPSFVGSVLARDAGFRALPCPGAIADLDLDAIRMIPTADGEVWCAGVGPDHRRLCEQATGVEGFRGETRLLRF